MPLDRFHPAIDALVREAQAGDLFGRLQSGLVNGLAETVRECRNGACQSSRGS